MVDNVGGAGGGDAMVAKLLQSALNASQTQNSDAADDARKSDAVQHRLVQKYVEKKQVESGHQRAQEVKETYTSERAADKNWRNMAEGKAGPELMQFANNEQLQGKVSGKLKEMFMAAQATDPGKAQQAAGAMDRLMNTQTFAQVAPTARDVGELAAQVLANPAAEGPIKEVLDHPFTRAPDGDAGTKQQLAKFASRQTDAQAMGRGASVRMAGDMLGTLSGAKVPGFGQQASLKMVERNPQNTDGIKNVDAFVKEPAVKAMPQMARGYATQVLAKGDGKAELKNSLTDVAKNDNFRAMGREEKGKLFATVGQGRTSDLRAITDQTLSALRQKDFPRQGHQVESFLSELGRQVMRGARATKSASAPTEGGPGGIDAEELVRVARRGGLPERPSLLRIPGSEEGGGRDAAGKSRAGEAALAGEQAAEDAAQAETGAGATRPGGPARKAGAAKGNVLRRPAQETEAQGRQVHNRAALQQYFGKLQRHYDRIEQKIKNAQYFEDVNMLGGLREPEEIDLAGLQVDETVAKACGGELEALKEQLASRQMPRAKYITELKAVQARAFARSDLSDDDKSYVYAKTAQAQMGQTFQELSGKKHRKLREVKNKLMPTEMRRKRLEPRRPQGVQAKFFRGGQSITPRGAGGASPSRPNDRAGDVPKAGGLGAVAAGAGAPGATATGARPAAGVTPRASSPSARAGARSLQTRDILAKLDPGLSPIEQMQQAKELMAQDMQRQAMQMASELMDAIFAGGSAADAGAAFAGRNDAAAKSATNISAAGPRASTPTGKTNFYGVPQSFERDLGAHQNVRAVRPPGQPIQSDAAQAGTESGAGASAGKALMKQNASMRPIGQLQQLKMKDMSKLEANALKNLGWDAVSWGAQGQPGAQTPTTYLTPFDKLRPLQRDSVRALGYSQDSWNAMVMANGGPGL